MSVFQTDDLISREEKLLKKVLAIKNAEVDIRNKEADIRTKEIDIRNKETDSYVKVK